MRRKFTSRGLAGGLTALSLSLAGMAAHADIVDDGLARIYSGDAAGAYALLKPAERERAGDPAYDYVLGLAAMDSGRPVEAVAAFERVLAVQPSHLQARAELGRAYIALNEPEAARRELDTVRRQNVPDDVRVAVDRYVTALDTSLSGGGTNVSGSLRVTVGYDSNVNNSTDETRILIPAFAGLGLGTLAPNARAQDDAFGEIAGRLSITHGLAIDRRLIADLTASLRGNPDVDDYSQAIAGLNVGIAQATPDHGTFTLAAQLQQFWLDGDDYRNAIGALGQWNYQTAHAVDLGVYVLATRLTYPGNRAMNVNRFIVGGTAGGPVSPGGPYIFGGAYAGLEEARNSAFDHLSYWFAGARAGVEFQLTGLTATYASAAVERAEYKDPEPLFLTERKTTRLDLTAGVRHALSPDLSLGAEISWTNADSNIVLYDYDRVVTSISIIKSF